MKSLQKRAEVPGTKGHALILNDGYALVVLKRRFRRPLKAVIPLSAGDRSTQPPSLHETRNRGSNTGTLLLCAVLLAGVLGATLASGDRRLTLARFKPVSRLHVP